MKRRISIMLAIILVVVIGAFTIYATSNDNKSTKQEPKLGFMSNLKELSEISAIMDLVQENFVDSNPDKKIQVNNELLLEGALKGMIDSLGDPHSNYFSKEEMQEFTEDIAGKFAGVGMQISKEKDDYLKVESPIEGTPAFRAGIKPQDKILEIDGESTLALTTNDCVKKLKGEPGTKVKVKVYRESTKETFDIELERAIIELKYVKHKMLDNQVGFVRLTQFGENVSGDVQKAVEDLLTKGMKGLILDLRFNTGGSLSEAIKISSFFLKDGTVVSVKDKAGNEQIYKREGKYLGDFPVVVLVNGGSASASEIVAGALKDRGRAILVGEKTFGKGSVQNVIPLPSGAGIKLTIALYYTPSGVSIHKKGIEPDMVVEETDAFLFFDGFVTNVDEEAKKEQQKELIEKSKLTQEEKDKLKNKEDTQLKTALGVIKGILLYKK